MTAKKDINSANGCDEIGMRDAIRWNVEALKTWIYSRNRTYAIKNSLVRFTIRDYRFEKSWKERCLRICRQTFLAWAVSISDRRPWCISSTSTIKGLSGYASTISGIHGTMDCLSIEITIVTLWEHWSIKQINFWPTRFQYGIQNTSLFLKLFIKRFRGGLSRRVLQYSRPLGFPWLRIAFQAPDTALQIDVKLKGLQIWKPCPVACVLDPVVKYREGREENEWNATSNYRETEECMRPSRCLSYPRNLRPTGFSGDSCTFEDGLWSFEDHTYTSHSCLCFQVRGLLKHSSSLGFHRPH